MNMVVSRLHNLTSELFAYVIVQFSKKFLFVCLRVSRKIRESEVKKKKKTLYMQQISWQNENI